MSDLLVPTALWHRHTQTDRDSPSSYKIDNVIVINNFLNPRASKSHQWLKSYGNFTEGVDLPIGGASAVEGLQSTGLPRLV